MRAPFSPKHSTASFTKDGITIRVIASTVTGINYLNMLDSTEWYTEEVAFDLCYKFKDFYGYTIEVMEK
ncbi:MAG: hypothetical protein ACYC5K_02350 [Saccharofermentanales bacterium]